MLIVMAFLMSSDSIEYGRLHQDGHEPCRVHREWPEGWRGKWREGASEGGRGKAVKTMIAFHQVRPIFYSSLKQSNLQKDNYALAPFYLLKGEWCQGLIAAVLPASTSANYPLSALVRHHGWIGQSINLLPPSSAYRLPVLLYSDSRQLRAPTRRTRCEPFPSVGHSWNNLCFLYLLPNFIF